MTYKEQHPKLPTKTHFSTFTEKDYPYTSYIYTVKCKEPIHFKPRTGKTILFPIKNYSNLHFELEDNTKFYPSNPYRYFLQKFKDTFHFLDMIVNDKNKNSCSTVIQNFTSHPAPLSKGIIRYIEIPITQTTPPHYRVHDVNSLIHSVIHTYHPDNVVPIKQNEYTDMYLCTRVIPNSVLEINKIVINDKTLQLPVPSITGNLRPSDKIRKVFPFLPYTIENIQFIKKFNFEYSDLTDSEYVQLCNIPVNNQDCYAKHKNDVGKISTPFRIRIKEGYAFIRGFYGLKGLPNFFTNQMSTFFRVLIEKRSLKYI